MHVDEEALQLALTCARSVEGRTSPRPPVGAAVMRNGELIATGATAPPYGPHAEVAALTQAGKAAQGADLYVTLEPCCIHVHTPPCTQAIMAAGIRRVIIGTLDPNPRVRTQGIKQLRSAGIEVTLLEDSAIARECAALMRPFEMYIAKGRPYVTAKWAMTLDGKLASRSGDAYWITGPEARLWVHDLRDRVDAILVGANTARLDNPKLTVRLPAEKRSWQRTERQQPLRVVLSSQGQLPPELLLLQPELANGTCILIGETCAVEQRQQLAAYGVEVIPTAVGADGQIDLRTALQILAQKGIMHVLIEGGASVLGSAFDQQCIDHVAAFIAPKLAGGRDAPSPMKGEGRSMMSHAQELQQVRTEIFGHDVLIEGDIPNA